MYISDWETYEPSLKQTLCDIVSWIHHQESHAANPQIIHIDMDAFYASVEQHDRPEFKGKPIIVGNDPQSAEWKGSGFHGGVDYGLGWAADLMDKTLNHQTAF